MPRLYRWRFALRFAARHALLSMLAAAACALFVFGVLYPPPFQAMLGVGAVFVLLLGVDAVCGPLLTLILASPRKSARERWVDLGLVGLVQVAALLYGLHTLWAARPVVLAFETDRLVVVTANEVDAEALAQAPEGLQTLPWWGVRQVGTRKAASSEEYFTSVDLSLAGISPAMRPGWWQPWSEAQAALQARAQPLPDLLQRRPQDAATLQAAVSDSGLSAAQLNYLPLTSRYTKDWVALLDVQGRIVGYAPVDGFAARP